MSNVYDKLNGIVDNNTKLSTINKLVTGINNTSSLINVLNDRLSKISHLEVPNLNEKFNKYKLLSELISSASDTSNQILELSNRKFPEISINLSEKMSQLNKISDLILSINNKNNQIDTLVASKKEIENTLVEVNNEINKIGVCPLCGQPIHNN